MEFIIKNKDHKKTVKIIDFNSFFKHRIDLDNRDPHQRLPVRDDD
ncbi:hypothetical protein Nizo2264_1624 [Lactiplantibacillus plantarum]|nr:hypothetical protein Nizo2264_1624 [Lactiplantibacillus plantarum]